MAFFIEFWGLNVPSIMRNHYKIFMLLISLALVIGCKKAEKEAINDTLKSDTLTKTDKIGTEPNGNSTDFKKAVEILLSIPNMDRSPKYANLLPKISTGNNINAIEFAVILGKDLKPEYLVAIMDAHSIPNDSASMALKSIKELGSDVAKPDALKPLCFGSCRCYKKDSLFVFVYGQYAQYKATAL